MTSAAIWLHVRLFLFLVTELSKWSIPFNFASNSSEEFRGKPKATRAIGRQNFGPLFHSCSFVFRLLLLLLLVVVLMVWFVLQGGERERIFVWFYFLSSVLFWWIFLVNIFYLFVASLITHFCLTHSAIRYEVRFTLRIDIAVFFVKFLFCLFVFLPSCRYEMRSYLVLIYILTIFIVFFLVIR